VRGRLIGFVLLGLVLGACRLQLDVNVEVEEDGSGSVEVVVGIDADGIQRIGGDLEAVLAVDDLEGAGWTIDGPEEEPDGFTRVRFRKPFDTPEEATAIVEEIAGGDGPFQDFVVTRDSSFAHTTWGFTGQIDVSGGLEAFGDDELAAELDGEPLGQSVGEIEAQLGESLSQVIEVGVAVHLPGEVTSNAPSQTAGAARWAAAFGEGPMAMEATGEEQRTTSTIAALIAATCAVLLLLYGVVRAVRWSRRRRRPATEA
jgi:hypothetical protein